MMNQEYQKEYQVSVGERPWGTYTVLLNGADHKVKHLRDYWSKVYKRA